MFKLVVLSALLAVAVAAPKPGLVAAAPLAYAAPVVAHSAVVGSVPTSVSSSSSTVVHNSAAVVAPVVSAYHAPAVAAYAAPAVHTVAAYAAAPAISSYSTHGIVNTYGARYAAAPALAYGVHGLHGVHVY
ncbi:hypothetical protein CBL_11896 [Carabus blaptoides fortunei]